MVREWTIDPSRKKMIQLNLWPMVVREIGSERWERLLRHLAAVETSTGVALRRAPRGPQRQKKKEDESCPLLLFAPDLDIRGRAFDSVKQGNLIYIEHNPTAATQHRYVIAEKADFEWWRDLTNRGKGVVISVLGYILLTLPEEGTILEFLGRHS
jgi:hypothetical protein